MRRQHVKINNEDYQLLNYIESTTNEQDQSRRQYIDINYILPSNYIKVDCKIMFTTTNKDYGGVLGARNSNGGFVMNWGYYDYLRLFNGKTSFDHNTLLQNNVLYNIHVECNGPNQLINVNNVIKQTTNNNLIPLTSPYSFYLFASNRGYIENMSMLKMYELQIYEESNTLVRNFKPMLRLFDNKPGMMDLANNVFYTQQNPTANEFLYG